MGKKSRSKFKAKIWEELQRLEKQGGQFTPSMQSVQPPQKVERIREENALPTAPTASAPVHIDTSQSTLVLSDIRRIALLFGILVLLLIILTIVQQKTPLIDQLTAGLLRVLKLQ